MSKYPNSGTLNRNDRRREGKNDSNARGKAVVTTVCAKCGHEQETEFWVDAWTKLGENGPWQSLSFKPKDAQPKAPSTEPDSDIPF